MNDAPEQALYEGTSAAQAEPDSVLLPGHDVPLGRYTTVRRLLPQRPRRMVGAWCFVDHFGPEDIGDAPGMQVPPHPHTGLQTVTWLVDGEILHHDSLGNAQTIAPGQLNLMTSGRGIAHSEHSPPEHPPVMHGLQLWVALPDAARHDDPAFEHHAELPATSLGDASVSVVVGEFGGLRSPARTYSPLTGAEIRMPGPGRARLPLREDFEYGVVVLDGTADVAGTAVTPGALLYLGLGRTGVELSAAGPVRLFLLGGEPFAEPLVMWWNFVARTHEEIVADREDWMAGRRFGTVGGCSRDPLPAPALPNARIKVRDRHGNTLG